MAIQLSNNVENMLASLERTMKLAADYGNGEFKNVNVFNDMAKKICAAEARHEKVINAIDKSKDAETTATFDEMYEHSLHKQASRNKNPKRFQMFKSKAKLRLQAASGSKGPDGSAIGDGDVMFADFVSNIDPITKKPMVNPVKNKKCGHHYEKDSILAAITINRQLRCPVAGCGNKDHITHVMLEDDPAFAKVLKDIAEEDSD